MFTLRKRESEPTPLDTVITTLLSEMAGYDAYSDEYAKMAQNVKTLLEAKANEPTKDFVSADTLVAVLGSLAGIIAILSFEKANVVTSKALGFVLKPKS